MIFVFGSEGYFETGKEVWVSPAGTARQCLTGKAVKVKPYVRLLHRRNGATVVGATFERGLAQEVRGFYARVLPPDAEQGLAGLDRNIEAAEEALRVARRDRQEYLAAHVVRGERIALKHIDRASRSEDQETKP